VYPDGLTCFRSAESVNTSARCRWGDEEVLRR